MESKLIHIEQFGLPRTGTNYIRWLLQENCNIKVRHRWGCKHRIVKMPPEQERLGDPLLLSARHPLVWLTAYYNWVRRKAKQIPFDQWLFRAADFGMGIKETPIEHWNYAFWRWLRFATYLSKSQIIIARHEDLLFNAEGTCEQIRGVLGAERKTEKFKNTQERLGTHGFPISGSKFKDTNWIGSKYLQSYPGVLLKQVIRKLNRELVYRVGYELP